VRNFAESLRNLCIELLKLVWSYAPTCYQVAAFGCSQHRFAPIAEILVEVIEHERPLPQPAHD
jgi:hypothetical protein